MQDDAASRRERLKSVYLEAQGCTRCPQLASTRTTVVFGAGNADADLMFVGEAPGRNEDLQGRPFVGQAGKLLETLLGEIGLSRGEVWICNVLRCRPPGNRDPLPQEIANCQDYLFRTIALVQPRVICTLGNFSTKLLRDDPTGIMRLRGRAEVRVVGTRAVRLYPIFHPAAALYKPEMLETLRGDFGRLPEILALEPPVQPGEEPVDAPVAVSQEDGPSAADLAEYEAIGEAGPVPEPAVPEPEVPEPPPAPASSPSLELFTPPPPDDAEEREGAAEREPEVAQLGLF